MFQILCSLSVAIWGNRIVLNGTNQHRPGPFRDHFPVISPAKISESLNYFSVNVGFVRAAGRVKIVHQHGRFDVLESVQFVHNVLSAFCPRSWPGVSKLSKSQTQKRPVNIEKVR